MKKIIGNLTLIIGVVISSLAAVEGQRVSRAAPVDLALLGEVLHTAVSSRHANDTPRMYVWQDRTIEAGATLDSEDIAWLKSNGTAQVLINRRAVDRESLPVSPDILGRVFASPVVLGSELETIRPGRLISSRFIQRLAASDLDTVRVEIRVPDPDIEGHTVREEVTYSLADGTAPLLGGTLREEVSLPVQLKSDSYIDEETLQRLQASALKEVEVKIPRNWSWNQWGGRWIFLVGILITLVGVLFKRARPDAAALQEEQLEVTRLREKLQELELALEDIGGRLDGMTNEAIHEELDKLLLGPVYTLAEGRNSIRSAHGMRVFTAVMDPFARGERKLNRAWSAAVDGYEDEARRSLRAALPAFREAREALPGTTPPRPTGFDGVETGMPLPPDVPIAPAESHWTDE